MLFDLDKNDPASIALYDDSNTSITYGEIVIHCLANKNILPPRSLVLALVSNNISSVLFILSCLENRWVPLIINAKTDKVHIDEYLKIYRPNAIFCDNNFDLSFENYKSFQFNDFFLLIGRHETHELNEELSLLLPTSGSTGSAKLVRHSYDNLTTSAVSVSQVFSIQENDIALGLLPIFYTMGFSVLTSHLIAGASVYLTNHSITDSGFWDILRKNIITNITGVPYTFELLRKLRFERFSINSLRIISQGGGKLNENVWDYLLKYCTNKNIQFIPTYGQTEATARMSFLSSSDVISKKGSIGKPIPNGLFEVVDEDKNVIERLECNGELVFKGPNVTLGYALSLLDLSKGDELNGILYTGDIVNRDEEGFYFIIGRKTRFVKIYGLRISLDDIEKHTRSHFSVDCHAIGTDDLITVYIDDKTIVDEVKSYLLSIVRIYSNNIRILSIDKIPRNTYGKIDAINLPLL